MSVPAIDTLRKGLPELLRCLRILAETDDDPEGKALHSITFSGDGYISISLIGSAEGAAACGINPTPAPDQFSSDRGRMFSVGLIVRDRIKPKAPKPDPKAEDAEILGLVR